MKLSASLEKPKKIHIMLLTMVISFAETMVFREFFNVMTVAGIRPGALPPVFGLMLGPYGVLGSVAGNLIADAISGYALLMILLGFVAKLAYGILPYFMWNAFDELMGRSLKPIRLNRAENVARYVVIVLINAVIIAAFVGSMMQSMGIGLFVSNSTLMLLLNNFVFCVVLGTPIIIFMSLKKNRASKIIFSMNERLVLIFLIVGVISGILIGIFVVAELTYSISDPVTMWMRIYMYIAINLFSFYVVAVIFLRYCEIKITDPVESITQIARDLINKEKEDSKIMIEKCQRLTGNKSEAGILAEAFRTMIVDLDTYIYNLTSVTAENERISTELNIAKQIQSDMLPNIFPAFPGRDEFEIYATMQPAKEVGGDFYDFFMIDDNHLGIVIADVSGKGIPAALFMVIAKTLIGNLARSNNEPKDVFTKVNSLLCDGNENAMFVTAWMGVLEINTGKMIYVNAGHEPPLVKRADGLFEYLATNKNMMLAGMDGIKYKQSELQMCTGDVLYLYTDGVTDANNKFGTLYGKERLKNTVNSIADQKLDNIVAGIRSDVDMFACEEPQFDDITMLILAFK